MRRPVDRRLSWTQPGNGLGRRGARSWWPRPADQHHADEPQSEANRTFDVAGLIGPEIEPFPNEGHGGWSCIAGSEPANHGGAEALRPGEAPGDQAAHEAAGDAGDHIRDLHADELMQEVRRRQIGLQFWISQPCQGRSGARSISSSRTAATISQTIPTMVMAAPCPRAA